MAKKSQEDDKARSRDALVAIMKIVPQLEEAGFDKWLKKLQLAAYQFDWYDPEDLEEGKDWTPETFDADDLSESDKKNKKMCFTTIYNTVDANSDLLEDVEMGDAAGAYRAITSVHLRATASGYMDAQKEFANSSMATDKVNLISFAALVSRRAKRCSALGGRVDEMQ